MTYKWVGDSPYTYIDRFTIEDLYPGKIPDRILIGPYSLLKISDEHFRDSVLFVRQDPVLGWLRVQVYRMTRLLDLIYRRFIITLAVWNLADREMATIPGWQDIRLIQKLSRVTSRVTFRVTHRGH